MLTFVSKRPVSLRQGVVDLITSKRLFPGYA
jgi:hypothetical protein